MRVIFGYHPASRRLCDLPHQGGVDGMLVAGEHRADQRPTGRTQEHRMALFAAPDLLDRLEVFMAPQADVDVADGPLFLRVYHGHRHIEHVEPNPLWSTEGPHG